MVTRQNEQTPLLPPADETPSSLLPRCRFPETIVNECLADLRTCVQESHSRKMLPVLKSDAPAPTSSVVVEAPTDATAPRSPGQIWVRPMTPMGTPPANKIPLGSETPGTDESDVVEATRARLLRCLAESESTL